MSLAHRLAERLIGDHPERAAAVLERLGTEAIRAALREGSAARGARLATHLSPRAVSAALDGLTTERAAALLAEVDLDQAARLLRRMSDANPVLEALGGRPARALRTLLPFPEQSAGGLMDPDVLALAEDTPAREALEAIREAARDARYNLYVIDRDQRLVGALNLRELMLASPDTRLRQLMTPHPLHLRADAAREQIVKHPGWKSVHSLPVVDAQGCYLGALRYRTLRALESQLFAAARSDSDTANALGDLFATGATALIDAFGGSPTATRPRGS